MQSLLHNFSLGGMLIESDHEMEIECKLPMEITLHEDKPINVLGRVVSCLMIKNKDLEHFDIGIEFLNLSEKDMEILNKFNGLLDTISKSPSSL